MCYTYGACYLIKLLYAALKTEVFVEQVLCPRERISKTSVLRRIHEVVLDEEVKK